MPSWQAPHQLGLFPVSVEWEPPFTMLVDLIGHGDHMVCMLMLLFNAEGLCAVVHQLLPAVGVLPNIAAIAIEIL